MRVWWGRASFSPFNREYPPSLIGLVPNLDTEWYVKKRGCITYHRIHSWTRQVDSHHRDCPICCWCACSVVFYYVALPELVLILALAKYQIHWLERCNKFIPRIGICFPLDRGTLPLENIRLLAYPRRRDIQESNNGVGTRTSFEVGRNQNALLQHRHRL